MEKMKQELEKYERLLPVGTSISYTESERRAGEFLVAMAKIATWKHDLSTIQIKYVSVQTAVYASEMSKGQAKTVTENKLNAEASLDYTEVREGLEKVQNDMSYLKAMYEIFQNAHIYYRTMSRGDNA